MSTDLQVLAGTAPSGVRTVSLPSSLIKERGGIRLRSAVRLVSSMPTLSDIASVSNHAHSIVEKHSRTEITVTNDQAIAKLAARGIVLNQLESQLHQIKLKKSRSQELMLIDDEKKRSVFQLAETETAKPEESLELHRSRFMMSVVNESRNRMKQSMKAISQKSVQQDWKNLTSGHGTPKSVRTGLSESGILAVKSPLVTSKEYIVYQKFASVLQQANNDLQNEKCPQIARDFASAIQEIPDDAPSPVNVPVLKEVFDMISTVVDGAGMSFEDRQSLAQSNDPARVRQFLIDQSLRYLAIKYSRSIDHQISTSLMRGSRSNLTEKLESFTLRTLSNRLQGPVPNFNLRFASGAPFWAVLFYAIRSGNKNVVLQIISQAVRNDSFPQATQAISKLGSFIESTHDSSMNLVPDKLSKARNLRAHCLEDYYKALGGSNPDPFELAVYLATCQVEPYMRIPREVRQSFGVWVFPTIIDYLWLRLKLSREYPNPVLLGYQAESDYEIQSFVQKLALQFQNESNAYPLEYVRLLFLSQNLPELIEFSQSSILDDSGSCFLSLHICFIVRAYGLLELDSIDGFAPQLAKQLQTYMSGSLKSFASLALDYLEFWSLSPNFTETEKLYVQKLVIQLMCSDQARLLDVIFSRTPFLKFIFSDQDPAVTGAEVCYKENVSLAYSLLSNYAKDPRAKSYCGDILVKTIAGYLNLITSRKPELAQVTSDFLNQCSQKYSIQFKEWPQHVSLFLADRSNYDSVDNHLFNSLQTLSKIHSFFVEISSRRYSNALDILETQTHLFSRPERLEGLIDLNGWDLILRLLPQIYKLCISILAELKSQRISEEQMRQYSETEKLVRGLQTWVATIDPSDSY